MSTISTFNQLNPLSDPNSINLFKKASVYFLIGGLSFIVAMTWSNAFSNMIQQLFPNRSANVIGHFLYAIVLTIAFIYISINLIDPDDLNNFNFFRSSTTRKDEDKQETKS